MGPLQPEPGPGISEVLAARPRVMWVAAHGDDESMGSGILMLACMKHQSACHFVVMTRDRGAECLLPDGCGPDLAALRLREMQKAARLYRATLEEYDFFNAPLPVESFPSRPEIERIWSSQGAPAELVARAIRRFKPDVVMTLGPYQGFTGHPEHQAIGRFTIDAVRKAADPEQKDPMFFAEPAHEIQHLYHLQNKYWLMGLMDDGTDPMPTSETVDVDVKCGGGRAGDDRSCILRGVSAAFVHRSQFADPDAAHSMADLFDTAYVRRFDPFGAEADELVAELQHGPEKSK